MVIDSAEWFIKVKNGLGWYDWLFLKVKKDFGWYGVGVIPYS